MTTEDVLERVALLAVFRRGVAHHSMLQDWPRFRENRGEPFVRSCDRLGEHYELTAAGHRRLAELDDIYQAPPHATSELEWWNDVDALICRAASLIQRKPGEADRLMALFCEGLARLKPQGEGD